ncbi:tRNA (adenosine(37)-N6)-dimethylallyltransferase MiaA [Roseivirga sp.]|uniref:tRNA (adenosine(37)-N6)-dimethylallyltransferase MiaA n=1 Tax=Roseivirga sp. TaxID=1964215 RepID=UPI003B8BD07C
MSKPKLICVIGPTAVGKTVIAIKIARAFKTEIISADSRQFYQELEIGTAKPSSEEQSLAKHHFVNNLSIHDPYSVGQYEKEAIRKLDHLFAKFGIAVLVGGSGLFVDAVCNGLDEFPEINEEIRTDLIDELESKGLHSLQEELRDADVEYYDLVDLNNPQRVVRALEVIRATGKTFTELRKRNPKERNFDVIKIGLTMERTKLYERIDTRMDQMIDKGLFDEVESLKAFKNLNALQTVGYKEVFGYLSQEYDKEEAIRLLKRNSRRYAKRQLTWFKRDENTLWFQPNELEEIIKTVEENTKTA